jgi:hypothetical protein
MKYYETHYEEYIQSVKTANLHPELVDVFARFPKTIPEMGNLILYGPTGSGKYSQLLYLLERYSPSHLKYDKRISIHTEKQSYTYRISDIHYEIDMGLLGCHSKALWHEVFFQIVDIVSMKTDKVGIIVCRNFHTIHGELLDVFYSYIQHCSAMDNQVHLRFVLLTEHVSFIPNNILNCCVKCSVGKPAKDSYFALLGNTDAPTASREASNTDDSMDSRFLEKITTSSLYRRNRRNCHTLESTDRDSILNLKEIQSFSLAKTADDLPKDIFNIICDNIIREMSNPDTLEFTEFRESLYDILIYNLDITDCLWYVMRHFIQTGAFTETSGILEQIYVFLKYYNNNYRPIYHLESIFFCLVLAFNTNPKR